MATFEKIEVKEGVDQETVDAVREVGGAYKYGWETDIEIEYAPKGLNTDIVKLISDKNEEPDWMTDWRLKALQYLCSGLLERTPCQYQFPNRTYTPHQLLGPRLQFPDQLPLLLQFSL